MVKGNLSELRVITGRVRFHYVNVFEPWEPLGGGNPKYGVCLLIPKEDKETVDKIVKAVSAVLQMGIGATAGDIRLPLRDGDEEKWDRLEFAGHYFMNATTKFKPEVVDKNCINITDPREFYSGCYGRAAVKFFSYNKEGNLGIGCSLYNIQKFEEGEELSTHISAAEDFRQPVES